MGDTILIPSSRTRRKVAVRPGFSQLDWGMLTRRARNLSGRSADGSSNGSADITMAEVRQHNLQHDAWTVMNGKVYNLTPYMPYHPGGADILMRAAGEDSTNLFKEFHTWVNAETMLEKCLIGNLAISVEDTDETIALHSEEWRRLPVYSSTADASDSIIIRIGIPPGKRLGLLCGQHLHLRLIVGPNIVERAFTPISHPDQSDWFEVAVRVYRGGALTRALSRLKPGDPVEVRGARGLLHSPTANQIVVRGETVQVSHVCMVAGGSGITPMFQLLLRFLGPASASAAAAATTTTATAGGNSSSTDGGSRSSTPAVNPAPASASSARVRVTLLYCARNRAALMLAPQLRTLVAEAQGQFSVVTCFSEADDRAAGIVAPAPPPAATPVARGAAAGTSTGAAGVEPENQAGEVKGDDLRGDGGGVEEGAVAAAAALVRDLSVCDSEGGGGGGDDAVSCQPLWQEHFGRIDAQVIQTHFPKAGRDVVALYCGPESFDTAVGTMLKAQGHFPPNLFRF